MFLTSIDQFEVILPERSEAEARRAAFFALSEGINDGVAESTRRGAPIAHSRARTRRVVVPAERAGLPRA